jgi:hypothetical protein
MGDTMPIFRIVISKKNIKEGLATGIGRKYELIKQTKNKINLNERKMIIGHRKYTKR